MGSTARCYHMHHYHIAHQQNTHLAPHLPRTSSRMQPTMLLQLLSSSCVREHLLVDSVGGLHYRVLVEALELGVV